MTNNSVIEYVGISKSEERSISICRYHFLDKLNFSNTQHPIVLFVSSIFMKPIKNLNSFSFPKISDNIKVQTFDIVTIEKLSSEFIKELHEIKIASFIIEYFSTVIEKMLQTLEEKLFKKT